MNYTKLCNCCTEKRKECLKNSVCFAFSIIFFVLFSIYLFFEGKKDTSNEH